MIYNRQPGGPGRKRPASSPGKRKDPKTLNTAKEMGEAYRMLFEIETNLRELVRKTHQKQYGHTWGKNDDIQIDLNNATFFQITTYLTRNPAMSFKFTSKEISDLISLKSVRNKVCHMRPISDKEFQQLEQCYRMVKTKSKRIV
ncbi:hypothetical protein [Evansella clarkii]|jgi:hypothetical protein|uniref:hypothetical protein n=1 Tax=Evansella clarkii TaxID=79879 RepID=UPI000997D2A4|nr:hypothetical protein [Evansella clarkii]